MFFRSLLKSNEEFTILNMHNFLKIYEAMSGLLNILNLVQTTLGICQVLTQVRMCRKWIL